MMVYDYFKSVFIMSIYFMSFMIKYDYSLQLYVCVCVCACDFDTRRAVVINFHHCTSVLDCIDNEATCEWASKAA